MFWSSKLCGVTLIGVNPLQGTVDIPHDGLRRACAMLADEVICQVSDVSPLMRNAVNNGNT